MFTIAEGSFWNFLLWGGKFVVIYEAAIISSTSNLLSQKLEVERLNGIL